MVAHKPYKGWTFHKSGPGNAWKGRWSARKGLVHLYGFSVPGLIALIDAGVGKRN